MKKKYGSLLWAALGVAVVVVIAVAVSRFPSAQGGPSDIAELSFAEDAWDLGDVAMADGISVREIPFVNTTGEALIVTRMETSCMCTTVQIVRADGSKSALRGMPGHGGGSALSETIDSGEQATLVVRFDPNAHGPSATGPISREITLATDSRAQPEIRLSFTGNVVKQHQPFARVTPQWLKDALPNEDFFLVDVHTPEQPHIDGTDAVIPFDEITDRLSQLPSDKSTPIVLYCRSGSMSQQAAQALANLGYTNVSHVEGGRDAYLKLP